MSTGAWGQRLKRSLAISLVGFITALALQPLPSVALSIGDLLRVLPSAIQIIQLSNISDRDEVTLGARINQQISREVRISRDPNANRLVQRIGQLLSTSLERPQIPYTFQVVDDPDINAFATMGGFVYINTGTIAAADNVAQLASVVAHEIGHIEGRHSLEQMRQQAIAQGIASVAGVADNRLVQLGTAIALRLPNSREAEFDADRRGLNLITNAGFAARAMPDFMQKLARGDRGNVPTMFSTHPNPNDRIASLNQQIAERNLVGGDGLNDQDYQRIWRSRFGRRG
ncbi:MAG: M48 family metalloprotease [Oscillatoriales cyanobacterium SM2_2_1]|nr:M48 family metalloprotease [Oscillatoriales cyanobacterium SM2_2_1]